MSPLYVCINCDAALPTNVEGLIKNNWQMAYRYPWELDEEEDNHYYSAWCKHCKKTKQGLWSVGKADECMVWDDYTGMYLEEAAFEYSSSDEEEPWSWHDREHPDLGDWGDVEEMPNPSY